MSNVQPSSDTTMMAAIIAAIISAVVSIVVCAISLRMQRRQQIHDQIDKLTDIGIQYPYLEDDAFCANWNPKDKSDEAMRYDNYCCFVFNLIERIWKFHWGVERWITDTLYTPELAKRHLRWWKSERNNLGGYPIKMHKYIDRITNGGK